MGIIRGALTEKEKTYIKENWKTKSYPVMAKELNRSHKTINRFCLQQGYRKRTQKRKLPELETTISYVFPHLAKEWNDEKNENLKPNEISHGSGRKVWWNCPIGHEPYPAAVHHRTKNHSGCPTCARGQKTSFPENAIYYYMKQIFYDAESSKLFSEWGKQIESDIFIPHLSLSIEYDGYHYHKHEQRKKNDEKKNTIFHQNGLHIIRIREEGLPTLSPSADYTITKKKERKEEILEHVIRQLLLYIERVYEKVLSKAEQERIQSVIQHLSIVRDRGEIYQLYQYQKKENSVANLYPHLVEEWQDTTLSPETVTAGADYKVKWKCKTCSHRWNAVVKTRTTLGSGCPKCKGCAKSTYQEVLEAFQKKNYLLLNHTYENASQPLFFQCNKHKEEGTMETKFKQFVQNEHTCPACRSEMMSKKMMKYTIESVRKTFENKHLTLLSDTYEHIKKKLSYVCNIHPELGTQKTSYSNLRLAKFTCKSCATENRKKPKRSKLIPV